ncbi:MAG: hypothetical protein J2P22_02960 [Nocardioides sp.]|nr:hypothetical protein [Nocardioides sp.]
MPRPTQPEPQPHTGSEQDRAAAARDRADRTAGGLSELLARRPDLRGVHAPADWLDDAIRWSV